MQITSLSSGTFVLDGFVYSIYSVRFSGLRYPPRSLKVPNMYTYVHYTPIPALFYSQVVSFVIQPRSVCVVTGIKSPRQRHRVGRRSLVCIA